MIESPLLAQTLGYINGRWCGPHSDATLCVRNPASGESLADVPDMGADRATEAVDAAAAAALHQTEQSVRARWVGRIAELLLENKHELARIITLEQGKPLKEAIVEVEYSAGFFDFFLRHLDGITSRVLDQRPRHLTWTVHHRPAGVAALVTPWNFPLAQLAKKVSAALAAGCAFVAKPADLTPLSAIGLWRLIEQLNLPPGMANLVIGRPSPIGQVFCTHPAVRVLSFTGSTTTGKVLSLQAAPHTKRLTLEMGGNAPFIVLEDSDVESAADALVATKFRCAGQTCVCANRVYVHHVIADAFADAVVRRVRRLRVGDGLEDGTDIGPLIGRASFEKVSRHVSDALERGARCIVGGSPKRPAHDHGYFFPPTVLENTTPQMLVAREETFGPVIAMQRIDGDEQAIELANATQYGLAAYLFTRDVGRAGHLIERLRFGHVGLNTGSGPTPEAPFGGMKQSGFGREGGSEGLLEFTETQTVASA